VHPTSPGEEFPPSLIDKLPKLAFINVTGGEPFMRDDLEEIVSRALGRAKRVVISTSGWFHDRIVRLARKYPGIGIRVSLEGLSECNDELRGRPGSFDRGLRTLLELAGMGLKDIGFGMTISTRNSPEILSLYELSRRLKMEFATAAVHNSFYFHKSDNTIEKKEEVARDIMFLSERLLRTNHPKNWFRAYFNYGLAGYTLGNKRLLPCMAGSVNFFLDPHGEVYPCNGMEEKCRLSSMGNLNDTESFASLWSSERARNVRYRVKNCPKNCWMIGTASPVMKKYFFIPLFWILKNKIRLGFKKEAAMPMPSDCATDREASL
jgi:radical SAM protein with 4Fe4S-binding SPASM domain